MPVFFSFQRVIIIQMAKILIVDDENFIRTLISSALADKHVVIEASNGKEGLYMFTLHHPDVIITDLNMPFMSGLELVRSIRSGHRKVKIIVHSAFASAERKAEMLGAGADLF